MAGDSFRSASCGRQDLRIALGFGVCEPVATFERSNRREGSDERTQRPWIVRRLRGSSPVGAVAMGTGVMIGAGIFALTGQVAQLAGPLFSLAFVVAALVSAFSAYIYIKLASAYPSAGGIGLFLMKAYGRSVMTGGLALRMVLSMVINESLVARTLPM